MPETSDARLSPHAQSHAGVRRVAGRTGASPGGNEAGLRISTDFPRVNTFSETQARALDGAPEFAVPSFGVLDASAPEVQLRPVGTGSRGSRIRAKDLRTRISGLAFVAEGGIAAAGALIATALATLGADGWQEASRVLAPSLPGLLAWSAGMAGVFSGLMCVFRAYDSDKLLRTSAWVRNAASSLALSLGLLLSLQQLLLLRAPVSAPNLLVAAIGMAAGLITWRFALLASLLQPLIRDSLASRVVVVGWTAGSAAYVRSLRRDLAHLREFVGCVPTPGGTFAIPPPPDVPVLGEFEALPAILEESRADTLILADASCPAPEIERMAARCQNGYIDFQLIPDYFPALRSHLGVRVVDGVPLLGLSTLPLDRTLNRIVKRALDIAGALAGLLLSAPLIVAFGILVYRESPGPVIYRQLRSSRSGRTFHIYKIRSMALDAEAATGPVWATRDDPRRLKIGALMRRANIDELPQFWNVLKGDMSLVGPRPERPELIERFKHQIPNYAMRHEVKAGLTGWAQIHGLRGDSDLLKRIEFDLHYLETWSPLVDLYCLAVTPFRLKNAH